MLINKYKGFVILSYQEQENILKDMDFFHFHKNMKTNITSKKVFHKAGKFIRNKIADAVTRSNDDKIVKQESVEEIIIPSEKREGILNKLKRVL